MIHLYAIYGDITEGEVEENEKQTKTEYDAEMETLYDQVEDAVEFAANANQLYPPAQIKMITYNLVFVTGIFNHRIGSTKTTLGWIVRGLISRFVFSCSQIDSRIQIQCKGSGIWSYKYTYDRDCGVASKASHTIDQQSAN